MDYTEEKGRFIAGEYSRGSDSLLQLHEAHPDRIPSPYYVSKWRRQFPTFDLLMQEAERAKAEYLAFEQLQIADEDDGRPASATRNRLQVRQWLASRLDKDKYGTVSSVSVQHSGAVEHKHAHQLTDDQLKQIAARGVIEGEAELLEVEPEPGD